jgi:hypothetical protein
MRRSSAAFTLFAASPIILVTLSVALALDCMIKWYDLKHFANAVIRSDSMDWNLSNKNASFASCCTRKSRMDRTDCKYLLSCCKAFSVAYANCTLRLAISSAVYTTLPFLSFNPFSLSDTCSRNRSDCKQSLAVFCCSYSNKDSSFSYIFHFFSYSLV